MRPSAPTVRIKQPFLTIESSHALRNKKNWDKNKDNNKIKKNLMLEWDRGQSSDTDQES